MWSAACSEPRRRCCRSRPGRWDRRHSAGTSAGASAAGRSPRSAASADSDDRSHHRRSRKAPRGSAFSVCSQPSQPCPVRSMPRSSQHCLDRAVTAAFEQAEVALHVGRRPGTVAGGCGDVVPVGIVRADEDHRIVRRAAAQRAGARIEDAAVRRAGTSDRAATARRRRSGGQRSPSAAPRSRTRRDERPARRSRRAVGCAAHAACAPAASADRRPASSTSTLQPLSASRAATVPPPAPEPTTT